MKIYCRWTLAALLLAALTTSVACLWSPAPDPTPQPPPTDTPLPTATPTPPVPTPTPVPPTPTPVPDAPRSIAGRWEGTAHVLGMELEVALNFANDENGLTGTIDIPQQGINGLALSDVRYNPPTVYFEIVTGELQADFEGTVSADTISGEFAQAGVAGSFDLKRTESISRPPPSPDPTPYLAYREEEVSFQNGDITLAGTLTVPPGGGPHPAVVLITGSGPQNRDAEYFGFKLFGIISDHLTQHGIAVLRYDDRGVEGSTGSIDQATTEDFAGDVVAAVELLKTRGDINNAQIGLLGHSEGGIVAPLAALKSEDVAFIILMAGIGVSGREAMQAHLELIAPTKGMSEQEIAERQEVQQRAFDAVRSGQGFEELEDDFRQQVRNSLEDLPEEERKDIADEEEYVDIRVQIALQAMRTPWLKFFLDYDPAVALRRVKVPVLAVFGELDLQVPAEVNRPAIERTLTQGGNQEFTSVTFPKANHLFQEAITGSLNEYATLDHEFVPGFLELMSAWILARVDEEVVVS